MGVENIVNVTITREGAGVSQAGFGIPLILGPNAAFADKSRLYTSLTAVAVDFTSSQDEYKAAQAIFAQNPRPRSLRIGKRAANVAEVQTITFSGSIVTSNSIAGTVNGEELTATVYATSSSATLDALAAKIAAVEGVASATVDTLTITVTAEAGYTLSLTGFAVTLGASQATVTIATTTAGTTVADALDDIAADVNDWYGLILTSRVEADVITAAVWAEASNKVFITASNAADLLTTATDDLASNIQDRALKGTLVLYHQTSSEFADAALMGRFFGTDPGASIVKFLQLAGITASPITDSQKANLWAKNGNTYATVGGQNIVENGATGSGQFLDSTRNLAYLQARAQEAIYGLLVRVNKIPFTDQGVQQVVSELRGVLARMVSEGVLAADPAPVVTYPKVADVSANDRAARLLPDINFTAREGGAVQGVEVAGVVSI